MPEAAMQGRLAGAIEKPMKRAEAAAGWGRVADRAQHGRRSQRLRWGWAVRGAWGMVVAAILLSGCTLFEGDGAPPPTAGTNAASASAQPATDGQSSFPNLGSVPEQPPPASTPAERQAIAEGLTADRKNAEYSDQQLTGQPDESVPPPPAPEPVTPEPVTPTPAAAAPSTAAAPATPAAPSAAVTSQTIPAPQPAAQAAQQPAEQPSPPPAPAATAAPITTPPPTMPAPTAPATPQVTLPPTVPSTAPRGVVPTGPFAYPSGARKTAPPHGGGAVTVDLGAVGGGPVPLGLPGGPSPSGPSPSGALLSAATVPLPPPGQPIGIVYFADGSASLSARAREVVRGVAEIYRAQGGQIRVIGHASMGRGNELANDKISFARAEAVARALIAYGVKPAAIQTTGAGARQPIYYEVAPTGAAGNRRAEIYLEQ
jgi:outer membrane protein OmpA-like peptidoglycan-associated protein